MFVTCFPWQIHFQSKKVRGKCLKIYVIRDKSLQPSLSAWLDGFHQSNSFMKGKRADVSLNLIFQLILMSFFPVTIGRIQKNQLRYSKKFSVFTTSESKSYISKRTNAFDNHGHIQKTRQRCDSWPMPKAFLRRFYCSTQSHEQASTTWHNY